MDGERILSQMNPVDSAMTLAMYEACSLQLHVTVYGHSKASSNVGTAKQCQQHTPAMQIKTYQYMQRTASYMEELKGEMEL